MSSALGPLVAGNARLSTSKLSSLSPPLSAADPLGHTRNLSAGRSPDAATSTGTASFLAGGLSARAIVPPAAGAATGDTGIGAAAAAGAAAAPAGRRGAA